MLHRVYVLMIHNNLKHEIVGLFDDNQILAVNDVKSRLPRSLSRQHIHRILVELIEDEELVRLGRGRWTRYVSKGGANNLKTEASLKIRNSADIDEAKIFDKLKSRIPSIESISDELDNIINYAFTEMLNNAIDHSGTKLIGVKMIISPDKVKFTVRDSGIGIFRNLKKKRNLPSIIDAVQDLVKGKVTTAPTIHSGEGIFFTSRLASLFTIESYGYALRVDNQIDDVFIEHVEDRSLRGTLVEFAINRNSKVSLTDIFSKYQSNIHSQDFDVTEIKIKLYQEGVKYISRSQAKRLVVDLDNFSRIILDFKGVSIIGQCFSDQVFRVFQHEHPQIEIIPINANKDVAFMINRVSKGT